MPDQFITDSAIARQTVGDALSSLLAGGVHDAQLHLLHPDAPLDIMAEVCSLDGELIALVSAHADGANVLCGKVLCSFDDGTIDERAEQVAGAVAMLIALQLGDKLAN